MVTINLLKEINKWGYLTLEQLSALTNRNSGTTYLHLLAMEKDNLIYHPKITYERKYLYCLTAKGKRTLRGDDSAETIKSAKVNWNEIEHQIMCIDFVVKNLPEWNNYYTEHQLKSNPELLGIEIQTNLFGSKSKDKNKFPDLVIEKKDGQKYIVEIERTPKIINRYSTIFKSFFPYQTSGYKILWVVPNEKMNKFITDRINEFNYKKETHEIVIF